MATITNKEIQNILSTIRADPSIMHDKSFIARDWDGEWYAHALLPVYNNGFIKRSYLYSLYGSSFLGLGTPTEPLCIGIFSGEVYLPEQQDSSS